jgi:hypothetical protein
MDSEDEEDDLRPEQLPIYWKGKEIFDMVHKIAALIPENDEYLNEVKACMLSDAALLTVKVAGAEAGGLYDHSTKIPTMTYYSADLKKVMKNKTN